ncbi:unnamed protein product [Ceratitis capitata]|uniref:(Mediterranean fruit fly) hypothetical protein n=1 Tax=Ceratitis capitata TaxID=7213 RepID=A0A811V071_CERCA|nr:unnamed protein product [Ceratitis capitata]
MLIKRLCCCAALTIFTNCVFGAPAANKTQRLKRQIFSNDFNFNNNNNNPFFRPTANNFNQIPLRVHNGVVPFLDCFGNCPTTSEYNPICASNQQQYQNPQKFDCARRCGADIQIVRRGACEGLFPMSRG